MIKANFIKDNQDNIQAVEISGHAGYADAGYDIVCAAVSAHAIAIENSLSQLLDLIVPIEVDNEAGGYFMISLPEIYNQRCFEDAQLLLSHLELSLGVIAANYPDFVSVNHSKQ